MTFNLQSLAAQAAKHTNATYEQSALAADTFSKAWELSAVKNAEKAKADQEAALKALFS